MTRTNWTQEMRLHLYRQLTRDFGPHRTCRAHYPNPGEWKRVYYGALRKIRNDFQRRFGQQPSIGAIENQVAFALTRQRRTVNRGYFANLILNKVAALEAGFITRDELPEYATFEYQEGAEGSQRDTPKNPS